MCLRILTLALSFAIISSTQLRADLFTYTTAADPKNSPDANRSVNGVSTGTATVWTTSFSTVNPSNAGSFSGNSANNGDGVGAGAGDPAWALYANSGHTASATASVVPDVGRSLEKKSEYISIDFDNGFIDFGASVGVRFLDASNTIVSTLQFTGGDSNYKIIDSVAGFDTGIGFTDDGFKVKVELTDKVGGYSMTIGATTFASRVLGAGANSIASIQVFNNFAGSFSQRDIYFNNLEIHSIPEPSTMLLSALFTVGSGAYWRRKKTAKSN